jgi:hypothetical protein
MNYQRAFPVFSIVFVLCYATCFFLNDNNLLNHGSLFAYYPALGQFHFSTLTAPVKEVGPVMMWYGWTVTSAVVGIIVALIVASASEGGFSRLWPKVVIWAPIVSFVWLCWMERSWFLR